MVEILLVRRVRQEGWRVAEAAHAAGVSPRPAFKWLARFRAGGERMLHDRSSAPARKPRRTPPQTVAAIEDLRRQRLSGPAIARRLGLPRSTVGAILRRIGLGRLAALDQKPPENRYERALPGELIHVDLRSSAASMVSGTASPASGPARAASAELAGRSSTSPSTMPLVWPTRKCSQTRNRRACAASRPARWPGSPAAGLALPA